MDYQGKYPRDRDAVVKHLVGHRSEYRILADMTIAGERDSLPRGDSERRDALDVRTDPGDNLDTAQERKLDYLCRKLRLQEYFRGAFRLLRAGGVFLTHGIACNPGFPPIPGPSFSDYYIFPDGELLPLGTTLHAAEASGFEVRDVESLRDHYVLTLRDWVGRLDARRGKACSVTDEKTYRLWRLYLAGAAHKFRMGQNDLAIALRGE